MPHYPYLIVGGGMAADSAIRGIREVDPGAAIGLVGAEPDPPYDRPPLSKGLWKGDPLERIWRKRPEPDVDLRLGRTIRGLDPRTRSATDDRGVVYTFGRCLLATGAAARRLPLGGAGAEQVVYLRTLADYRRLRQLAERGQRFAVVGGGFIGSEIAAALATIGKVVVMVFPGPGIGANAFPSDLSAFVTDYYRQKGVETLAGWSVVGLEPRGDQLALRVGQTPSIAREILVDGVVAGIGVQPSAGLAADAGLAVDNGIVVDEFLRTAHPDIYAAGDVANFYSPALGKRRRVEHEDAANTMGRQAGRAMAGEARPYRHTPFFYSDLFDLGYEAVGELDARLPTVADWQEPYRQGVVYYLRGDRVCGVLLWNTWGQVDPARELLVEPGPFASADLVGRLPEA